jgi:hypothetical protein
MPQSLIVSIRLKQKCLAAKKSIGLQVTALNMTLKVFETSAFDIAVPLCPILIFMGTVGGFAVNVESFKGSFVSSSLNHKIARLQKCFSATNALDYM